MTGLVLPLTCHEPKHGCANGLLATLGPSPYRGYHRLLSAHTRMNLKTNENAATITRPEFQRVVKPKASLAIKFPSHHELARRASL